MDDLSSKKALIYDYGYNIGLARRLSREFGKVEYFSVWKDKTPESRKLAVGDGFPEFERVRNFFDALKSADIVIFPDIYDGDLQVHIEEMGIRVWGSRKAEKIEYNRSFFASKVEELGLDPIEHEVIYGLHELEEFLEKNEDYWIKVDLRGDGETWHHKSIEFTTPKLNTLRHKYGVVADEIKFTVCKGIDSIVEAAYDGFMVTSPSGSPQFSDYGFLGYEDKDTAHILTAVPYDDFPRNIKAVNDAFAYELAKYRFRSAWGTEIKRTEDGKDVFLDATCRQPSPPGEIISEMVLNLGLFIWHGSSGDIIPLEVENKFGVQVEVYSAWSKANSLTLEIDPSIEQWTKPVRACFKNGMHHILPDSYPTVYPEENERVCSVVALGNTIEEAIENVRANCEGVSGINIEINMEPLAECLRRIKEGEKEGIEFTDLKIPEPSTVLEGE